jgi:hypothetical protein
MTLSEHARQVSLNAVHKLQPAQLSGCQGSYSSEFAPQIDKSCL